MRGSSPSHAYLLTYNFRNIKIISQMMPQASRRSERVWDFAPTRFANPPGTGPRVLEFDDDDYVGPLFILVTTY